MRPAKRPAKVPDERSGDALSATVLTALKSGRKLEAIKALRSETGLSLNDSVARVTAQIALDPNLAAELARREVAMRGQLRGVLLVAVLLVGVAAWVVFG